MVESRPRPFLDANVLFSGIYHNDSVPGVLIDLHADGMISIVVSAVVLDEVSRNFRRKQPSLNPRWQAFLSGTPPEIVSVPSERAIEAAQHCINAKDAPILAAAIASGADCVVSGNTRHFNQQAAECAGIAIFTPAAYLALLDHRNGLRR